MTTRQALEIVCLGIVCIASLRAGFWRGSGFNQLKKTGLLLAILVFLSLTIFILHH